MENFAFFYRRLCYKALSFNNAPNENLNLLKSTN